MGAKHAHWPVLAVFLLVSACGNKAPKTAPPLPVVGYVVMTTSSAPLQIELPARTTAFETADVRPQVNGVIKARRFQEGSVVREGQTLYEIDPSFYQAAAAQAAANLANAEAMSEAAAELAARDKLLVPMQAVAKQDYVNAVAAARQAAANVLLTRAALEVARINLRWTKVPAPITGRSSRSLVTTGALVTAGQTVALTTIERLDPMFADIPQSSAALTALRHQLVSGGATPASTDVQLVLEDGSLYPHTGRIEFAEAIVDPTTGAVTLRSRFPNPKGLLLPGMFVRARFTQAHMQNVVLAPQQGVSRDPKGNATVLLVGPSNKLVLKSIVATNTIGPNWIVTSGLAPGDKVIVEGVNRVKPGQVVRPVPATAVPQAPGPAPAAGGGAPPVS
jgi:membrane fusion protein (multidrug efflux system)